MHHLYTVRLCTRSLCARYMWPSEPSPWTWKREFCYNDQEYEIEQRQRKMVRVSCSRVTKATYSAVSHGGDVVSNRTGWADPRDHYLLFSGRGWYFHFHASSSTTSRSSVSRPCSSCQQLTHRTTCCIHPLPPQFCIQHVCIHFLYLPVAVA